LIYMNIKLFASNNQQLLSITNYRNIQCWHQDEFQNR
jgi:hypothetical protein